MENKNRHQATRSARHDVAGQPRGGASLRSPAGTGAAAVEHFVGTVVAAQPDKPVFCIDLLTYFDDFVAQPEFAVGFRDAVKKIAGSFSSGNVHYIDGRELLVDPAGLRTDLVHPGDIGMQEMGQNLAEFISRTV